MVRTLTIKNREYLTLALVGVLLAATAGATLWQVTGIERSARS